MYTNLRTALRETGITQVTLSKILGLSEKSIINKLNGVCDWTLSEANTIKSLLLKYDRDWLFTTSNESHTS